MNTRQGHATTHPPPWRRRRQSQTLRARSLLPPAPVEVPPPVRVRSSCLPSRWLYGGRGARPPLLAFFGCGPAAVSSSLSEILLTSASGDPAPDSPGKGGGIGSRRLSAQGGRAGSPWSASRARTRGLSIVPGSPPSSAGSSPGSGRRGPPCRRSRWSGCPCNWSPR